MNKKMIFHTLGSILKIFAFLMLIPLIVTIVYKESTYLAFLLPALIIFIVGLSLTVFIKPSRRGMSSKEGFVIVGLSWIVISILGSLPYIFSGSITNFIDALFETVSGFTTTGATILEAKEEVYSAIPKSVMFYRAFTHFVGGMGVLVFVLAIIPQSDGENIYILKAESTGPQVGKLVSKLKITARILYLLYIGFTITEVILLALDPKMDWFNAIIYSFSTAGTGGFAPVPDSCASLSNYAQIIIAVFMLLFGVNFNIYFLIFIGKFSKAIKSEELLTYLSLAFGLTLIVSLTVFIKVPEMTFGTSLKDSFFQTVSYMTSTGFSNSSNVVNWPTFAKTILFTGMFLGACAGSTGGGLKTARIIILFKSCKNGVRKIVHPKAVEHVRLEGGTIDEEVETGVLRYFITIIGLVIVSTILFSLDGFDIETCLSAASSCINNVGAAFGKILSDGTFGFFSPVSKILMSILMLIGRLELYPILVLFSIKAWKNK